MAGGKNQIKKHINMSRRRRVTVSASRHGGSIEQAKASGNVSAHLNMP